MTTSSKKLLIVGVGETGNTQLFRRLSEGDQYAFDDKKPYDSTVMMASNPTIVNENSDAKEFLTLGTFELRDSPGQLRFQPGVKGAGMHQYYKAADIIVVTLDPMQELEEQIGRYEEIKEVVKEAQEEQVAGKEKPQFIFVITKSDLLTRPVKNKCLFTPEEAIQQVGEVIFFSAITGFSKEAPKPETEIKRYTSEDLEDFLKEIETYPKIPRSKWKETEEGFLNLSDVLIKDNKIDRENFDGAHKRFQRAFQQIKQNFFAAPLYEGIKTKEVKSELLREILSTKHYNKPRTPIEILITTYTITKETERKIRKDILLPLRTELDRLLNNYLEKNDKKDFNRKKGEPECKKSVLYHTYIDHIKNPNAKKRAEELFQLVNNGYTVLEKGYKNEQDFNRALQGLITDSNLSSLDKYNDKSRPIFPIFFPSLLRRSAHGKTYDVTAEVKEKISKIAKVK